MKKVLTIILLISFVVCLTACGNTSSNNLSEEQIRKIVEEEIAQVEQPSADIEEITKNVMDSLETKSEFVVGQDLEKLFEVPCSIPYAKDTEVNVQEISITKSEILNPNEADDYIYDGWGGYTFYRYKYSVTIKGNTNTRYAGRYIRIKMYFPNGALTVNTYFEGNLLETEHMSGGYNSATNKTELGGCVFKVQNDGSFTGEFTGYSNDNLNEFMITSISNVN